MRILYVGLSRAEKLLILPKLTPIKAKKGTGTISHINNSLTDVGAIDNKTMTPASLKLIKVKESALSKVYSYTADYLAYERCPRQYMIYRKYGFVPSRSQTMFLGLWCIVQLKIYITINFKKGGIAMNEQDSLIKKDKENLKSCNTSLKWKSGLRINIT